MVLFCIKFSLGADCFSASEVASSGVLKKSTHNGDCDVPQGVYNFDDLVIEGGNWNLWFKPNVTINVKNNFKCGGGSVPGNAVLQVEGTLIINAGLDEQSSYSRVVTANDAPINGIFISSTCRIDSTGGGYYMGDSRMTQHKIPTNPYTYYYRCYNCGWGDAMGGSHGGRGGHSHIYSGRMSSKTYGDFMEPISWGQAGIAGRDRYGNTHRNSRKLSHGHLQWLVKVY